MGNVLVLCTLYREEKGYGVILCTLYRGENG